MFEQTTTTKKYEHVLTKVAVEILTYLKVKWGCADLGKTTSLVLDLAMQASKAEKIILYVRNIETGELEEKRVTGLGEKDD